MKHGTDELDFVFLALLKDSIQQKETISERDLALDKSKKELDRAKEEVKFAAADVEQVTQSSLSNRQFGQIWLF